MTKPPLDSESPTVGPSSTASPDDPTIPPQDANRSASTAAAGETGHTVRYFGDYELLAEIARGGMGVVYKARQTKLDRLVALKMILAGQLAGQADVQRFYAEAESAAKLDHAGIVPIFDTGQHQGQHYFSMAYVEGSNLAASVAEGPLASNEAAQVMAKVAEAIQYAHEKGVIHRDLKPSNILLDERGEPKVTDFGLAKKVEGDSGLTATGQVLGTPSYMPPEQAAGKMAAIDGRSDVYSLGAVLYCLLTGRPPFQASNVIDTLVQVLESSPVPPRMLNPHVDEDLEAVCLKCLEKDPADRYGSAQDLAEDLSRFLAGEPVLAHRGAASRVLRSVIRETRHAEFMDQLRVIWAIQAAGIFLIGLITNILLWMGVEAIWPYLLAGLVGAVLYVATAVRHLRQKKQFSFLEKQVGQVWGAFVGASILTVLVGGMRGIAILDLVPLITLECAIAFSAMGTVLGGSYYPVSIACAVASLLIALAPQAGPLLFGAVFSAGLIYPTWRHWRHASSPDKRESS